MALPENGISIPMVARELGTTENDLGRLCTHANINMWAKYKPIKLSTAERLTKSKWWEGYNGMCGLKLQSQNLTVTELKDKAKVLSMCSKKWLYDKPEGGSQQPFSLGDFRGYDKESKGFVETPNNVEINTFHTDGSDLRIPVYLNTYTYEMDNVLSTDIKGINWDNIYLTAVLFNGETWIATIEAENSVGEDVQGLNEGILVDASSFPTMNNGSLFIFFRDKSNNNCFSLPAHENKMPIVFSKKYTSPVVYNNQYVSYNKNGIFKTLDDIDPYYNNPNSTLIGKGSLAVKVRVNNNSDVRDVTIDVRRISCSGISMLDEEFSNIAVDVYVDNTLIDANLSIPKESHIDIIIVPRSNVMLWDGSSYPLVNNKGNVEMSILYDSNMGIFNGTFEYRYNNGDEGWGE